MATDIPGYVYAGLIAAGGIVGYYKAGSVPSLASGLVFGTVLAYGAHEVSRNPQNYGVQLAATSMLTGVMGYRLYQSKKFGPAAGVTLLSTAMLGRIALRAIAIANLASQYQSQ